MTMVKLTAEPKYICEHTAVPGVEVWLGERAPRLCKSMSPRSYRCLVTSGSNIQGVRMFECNTDVILRASGFMKAHPEHPAIEIWEAKRFVARLTRNPLAKGGLDPASTGGDGGRTNAR